MDDFENFEFIDYTTSGPWERFITQIEDSLRSWGLVDNSLGVFDPAAIAASEDGSDALSTPNPATGVCSTGKGHNNSSSSNDNATAQSHSPKSPKSKVYQLREMLSLDDATYALSYQYHPAKIRLAEGVERIDLDFLPNSLEGVVHHNLHRWTAQTHILIISPVTISDIFTTSLSSSSSSASSAIIDLSSAKLLLSSFAIAFQNTGCNIPVFVPTGQPWNMTFTGLMIQSMPSSSTPSDQPDILDDEHDNGDQAIEVRFNTVHVPYPPVQYTHLSGIMDYFIERMGIEDDDPASLAGNHSQSIKEQIHASALFSYDLVNWRDEDWKRWGNPLEDASRRASSSRGRDGDDATFQVDEEPTMNTPSDSVNIEDMKTENRALSLLPIPVLPFGPVQDPLKSLRLLARFASAPCTVYLDSKDFADMDASYANIWILQATFKEGDYGILSGIMEDAIASWSSESVGQGRAHGKAQKDQTYSGALLNKGAKLIQGTITMVDAMDVENIIDALFEMPVVETSTKSKPTTKTKTDCGVRITPASELGLQFKHATTVPYNSFLWRMIQYLIDVISPNSEISYATSVMGFLKVLWSELLKQFYTRWENSLLIPMVDIYGGGAYEQEAGSDGERKPVAIDLRYSLLHQKLSMLNCCIARQIVRNKETPRDIHPILKRRKEKVTVEDKSELNPLPSKPGSGATSPTSEQTYGAQFQNLLHGLSDISRPRSADVVPMAKRLLKNVKNRAVSSQQESSTPSASSSSVLFTGSKTEPSSPTASMPIPLVETPRRRHSSSRRSSQLLFHPTETTIGSDDDDDDVFYDPMETSEVILDPVDMQRRAHSQSLTESFVALKYSSSADSQSGILVNDLDQMTVSASGPDPREVADPHKSEGGLKPLKDLKLLETGAPLMIPKLQEPGYMTEDMIQQQEELFETLGSSSDGAKMRAKMQSTQLISDMEAFKAANPGCVLGDFIRWHSPKDWAEDKRQMSARMADAGNYWQELWTNSKRIPVSRQTPLFNYNQEAAKVLFYLDSLSGDQLFLNLLPSMFLLAYDTLVSHPVASHIRQVAVGIRELAKELTVFPWNELTAGEEDLHLDVVIDKFRDVELLMGRAIALVRKFPEQYRLVERILEDLETVVEDGDERECVYDLFSIGGSLQSSFPQPTSREFVLETFDPSDMSYFTSALPSTITTAGPIGGGWHTRPLQRRMYACFKESEVRIVEAVAKDGMYM